MGKAAGLIICLVVLMILDTNILLLAESVLPYGAESFLNVEETGYGRSVPVEAEEDVRFEHE